MSQQRHFQNPSKLSRWHFILSSRLFNPCFRHGGLNTLKHIILFEKFQVPSISKVFKRSAWIFNTNFLNSWISTGILEKDVVKATSMTRSLERWQYYELGKPETTLLWSINVGWGIEYSIEEG